MSFFLRPLTFASQYPNTSIGCAPVQVGLTTKGRQFRMAISSDAEYIVTEGASFEELQENIRDAVAPSFEGDDPVSLGFDRRKGILAIPSDRAIGLKQH